MKKNFLFLFFLSKIFFLNGLKLDRVILSTDNNPLYIEFWPIVAKAWQTIVGIKPTLALIGDSSVKVDESLGDVLRFEPIPGISTAFYAQCIRLLLPAIFENDTCILADIDMIPLKKSYFVDQIKDIADDAFVTYRMYDSSWISVPIYPICYIAAKGNVFKEIFNIKNIEHIPKIIINWASLGYGWTTDEMVLGYILENWNKNNPRFKNLKNFGFVGRIDRDLQFNDNLLKKIHYVDFHCPRPFSKYKNEIESIVNSLTLRNCELNKEESENEIIN